LAFPQIQQEFQIRKSRTYLNNASIAPMADRVVNAVDAFMEDVRHNGRNNFPNWARHADSAIRDKMARLIGAQRSEVAFLKNTTEGLSIVANGIDWRQGDNVVIADIEYPSNVYCWMNLARFGVSVKWFPARDNGGRIPTDQLAELVDGRTRLISLSAVQFSNGFRSDLAAVGELCRKKGIYLNLDAIQWLGALHMNVEDYNIHFMSAGGHKWLMAPIGTGLFYVRKDMLDQIHPFSVGFHTVDKPEDHMDYDFSTFRASAARFEEALVNYPGIWGFEAAIDMFLEVGTQALEEHVFELTSLAIDEVKARGYEVTSSQIPSERSGIVSFRHPTLPGEELRRRLNNENIDVAVRDGRLRISPGIHNDSDDIRRLIEALPKA
jgi:cysteine desulfurase / selenocysteine lyase